MLERLARNGERLDREIAARSKSPPSTTTVAIEDLRRVAQHARSDNFRVTVLEGRLDAEEVLAAAESLRTRIGRDWTDRPIPAGRPRVSLQVSLTPAEDCARTRMPIRTDDPLYRITIAAPDGETLRTALAHELTHVVLHARFGDRIPAWFDEGIASLEDAPHRTRIRRQVVDRWIATGRFPDLKNVMSRESIAADDVPGYAAATSLTRYLLTRMPREDLAAMIDESTLRGREAAFSRFGLPSSERLQTEWQHWVKSASTVAEREPRR